MSLGLNSNAKAEGGEGTTEVRTPAVAREMKVDHAELIIDSNAN